MVIDCLLRTSSVVLVYRKRGIGIYDWLRTMSLNTILVPRTSARLDSSNIAFVTILELLLATQKLVARLDKSRVR